MTNTDLPDLATQRAMLQNAIGKYRCEAFDAMLQRHALEVQKVADEGAFRKALRDLKQKEENMYASAREMQRLLDALPPDADAGV